jgi:hypothetical protein
LARGTVLAVGAGLRVALIALLFCGYVIAEWLDPFQFGATASSFGRIPFLGFMSSFPEIGVLSFFQKFFLFGSSIWLLAKAGLRLRSSTLVVAVILFMTSEAETFAQPIGGDHRYCDGFAHRCDVRADGERNQTQ